MTVERTLMSCESWCGGMHDDEDRCIQPPARPTLSPAWAAWADNVDEDFHLNPREWLDMAVSDYVKALKMVEDMHDEEGPALRLELARVGLLVARELREQA